MPPLLRLTLATLLFIGAAIPAHAAMVSGTVGTPSGALPGAVVSAYDANGFLQRSVSTDASGRYFMTIPAGSYRLLAYDPSGDFATVFHPNAESFETSVFVSIAEDAPVEVSFTLPRAGVLAGSVTGGNMPLAAAVIEVYNLSGTRRTRVQASASGAYSLVLPAGEYKVFAYDANDVFAGVFAPSAIAFADAALVRIDPPATTTVFFSLTAVARVSGVVLDAETQAPLPEKLVYVYTTAGALVTSRVTDAAGVFRVSLAAGSYRFVGADPAGTYAPVFYVASRSFEASDVVPLAAGAVRSDLTLAAERGGAVSGQVNASVKTTVIAYNPDGTRHASTETSESGAYRLVTAPGTYKLAVTDFQGQYAAQFYSDSMLFAEADEVAVFVGHTLTGVDFTPARAGRFAGTVRDGGNGQPLGGMTVVAYDLTGRQIAQATTGTSGDYRLALAPGQYRLLVFDTHLEYATAYATGATSYDMTPLLSVEAGVDQAASFAMFRGVRVTGTVVEEHGATLDGIEVFALDATGNRVAAATTTSVGIFTLVVQSGMYTLVPRDPYHRYTLRVPGTPVAVGPTPPTPVTLMMQTVTRRRTVRS
jgi:hypothetical protein